MPAWFPFLLVAHICLALALLAPSLVLPFLLRRAEAGQEPSTAATVLARLQGTGTLLIGLGLAVTGAGLLLTLGIGLLGQPWLLVALGLYAANLLVAAFVSRPNLRRLIGIGQGRIDEEAWKRRARRQRYVAYGMAAATGAIGFLMSTKPELW
jgi:hypothetical protein